MGGRFMTPPRWQVRHTILEEGKNPFPQKLCFCGYDIMPSTGLIRHEWQKHGTCTGLNAESYFDLARKAYQTIRIPTRFTALSEYLNISPAEVKKDFVAANSGAPASAFVIGCSSNYLSEVRICLDRNLKPIPCQGQRDCRAPKVRMPPVR